MRVPLFRETTPLGAGAGYTSPWYRVDYIPAITDIAIPTFIAGNYIVGLAFADQAGTLFIEQSNNGVTVHRQESFPVLAGLPGTDYNRRIFGSFVRIRYVNGIIAQGVFDLSGKLVDL